jgi:arylsulfatase A-like enzyme/Tfp pilus assembly protein PilF
MRRYYRVAPVLVGVAALGLVSFGCRKTSSRFTPRPSPNVLLVSIDTLRADHLGCYGASSKTPTLDGLAAEGVLFERAVSHVPLTLPSHTSMLTGTYPIRNGVRDNGAYRLGRDHRTLASIFRAGGYRTGAFVGSFPLDSRFGLDQGFDVYDDVVGEATSYDVKIAERPADEVLRPAARWIVEGSDEPFFAFVHLYDPHSPYEPPPPFARRFEADPYSGEIAYVDDALGRFFSRLADAGRMENTIVVVTSDHGEGLGEHGEKTHGMFAYDSTLHVPLIFRWKGAIPEGVRVAARVRLIDVAPTLTALAGLPPDRGFQGASLVDAFAGRGAIGDRESYFEALSFNLSRNWAPLTGLYRENLKFIQLPIPELYDLRADPGETKNLAPSSAASGAKMASELSDLVSREGSPEAQTRANVTPDAETLARLKSLGYVVGSGAASSRARYTEDDDPKRLLPLADKLDAGTNARIAGHPEEAIRIYREILAERPSFTRATILLAHVLEGTGRVDEAIGVLQQALTAGQESAPVFGMLGFCLEEKGRAKEAVAMLRVALDKEPGNVEAWNSLALAYARLGERDDALGALDRLLAIDPGYASAYVNRGSVHLEEKKFQDAENDFHKAIELDDKLAEAWNGLGVASAGSGNDEQAVDSWKRAVELDPSQFDAMLNLALLLRKLGRVAEEAACLERFVRAAPRGYETELRSARERLARLPRPAS